MSVGPEGPKWQGCFDTFCACAQKVWSKGWQSTLMNWAFVEYQVYLLYLLVTVTIKLFPHFLHLGIHSQHNHGTLNSPSVCIFFYCKPLKRVVTCNCSNTLLIVQFSHFKFLNKITIGREFWWFIKILRFLNSCTEVARLKAILSLSQVITSHFFK